MVFKKGHNYTLGKKNGQYRHGMNGTNVYCSWAQMKGRCNNSKSENYRRYGGRGITYDQKWEIFEGYWEDMKQKWIYAKKKYPNEILSIDRIDNDGNYCKENCRIIPRRMNCGHAKLNSTSSKPVWMCDKETGEKIKRFLSAKDAERNTNAVADVICGVCKGRFKTSGGFGWQYA